MEEADIILYRTPDGAVKVEIRFEDETFWLTQKPFCETVRAVASPLKKCPNNLDFMTFCKYVCSNRTRHASRQISVPGRVFYF